MALQVAAYTNAIAVTKSDTTVLNCLGFYVGGAGDVAILPLRESDSSPQAAGSTVTFVACIVGKIYQVAAAKIMSTNTSATNIVALY